MNLSDQYISFLAIAYLTQQQQQKDLFLVIITECKLSVQFDSS